MRNSDQRQNAERLFNALSMHSDKWGLMQQLALRMNYDRQQLARDIQDLKSYVSEQMENDRLLDRITAAYNADTLHRYSIGELDTMPEEHSRGDILKIILAEYALKNFPDILTETE